MREQGCAFKEVWSVCGVLSSEGTAVPKAAFCADSGSAVLQERRQQLLGEPSLLFSTEILVISGLCSLGDSKELLR